jgi:hypothetical protein
VVDLHAALPEQLLNEKRTSGDEPFNAIQLSALPRSGDDTDRLALEGQQSNRWRCPRANRQLGEGRRERENTLGADQANKASNTGVDVPETQTIDIITKLIDTKLIDLEGADPRSERNFSFDTEKEPAAVSDTKN